MLVATKTLAREIMSAVMRVVLIFVVLSSGLDSLTRVYYSYAPITRVTLECIKVERTDNEIVIKRDRFSIWYDGAYYHIGLPLSHNEFASQK